METFEGIVAKENNKTKIWEVPFDINSNFITLPKKLIVENKIKDGMRIKCKVESRLIMEIMTISGRPVKDYQKTGMKQTIINPNEKFEFGKSKFDSLRILDLFVPIAKGTRGLIVSPPKAGKTTLLENLTKEINLIEPEVRTIVLLIDERPEEITEFQMNTNSIVFHSSMDQDNSKHIRLAKLMIKHIEFELDAGNDIVILLDSLTRIGRAFNRDDSKSRGKTLSGGLGANALQIPRKLFGLGRNIQEGGSCTILATILKDTGSRMDEIIFQEFKGTGNCDIILDRDIAEQRIFPAINIQESGTRKDEKFISLEKLEQINSLRRNLLKRDKADAISFMKQLLKNYDSNNELLKEA